MFCYVNMQFWGIVSMKKETIVDFSSAKVDKKLISCKTVFCLVGDKVPCKDSRWSNTVPIWSKKIKEVFMLLFSCLYSL